MPALVTQRNDKFYLTAPLEVVTPSTDEIASFGFGMQAMESAPNDNILWLRGHYVESDTPNRNGQMWTGDEVAIKSLTPRLMPVTEMHDPSTAVGVIADTKLSLPGAEGENASIDTILAIWAHRFPKIAEEAKFNAERAMLMQSMECDAPTFSCSECAATFVKPVDQSEWCEHLQNGSAVRTLSNVTFTGTGLIFGSRGTQGADPLASLSVLGEVAQWSDSLQGKRTGRSKMTVIEIEKSEYDELKAKAVKLEAAEAASTAAQEAADAAKTSAKELESKLTEAEKTAEDKTAEAASLQEKVTAFEEKGAQDELASKRMSEVSAELAKALPDGAKGRLAEKARTLTDEEWTDEVASTAELLKVKNDGAAAGNVFAEEAMFGFNPKGKQPDPALQPEDVPANVGLMIRNMRKNKK